MRGQRGWGGGGGPGRGRGVGGAASSLLHDVVVPLLGPGHRGLGRGDTGNLGHVVLALLGHVTRVCREGVGHVSNDDGVDSNP